VKPRILQAIAAARESRDEGEGFAALRSVAEANAAGEPAADPADVEESVEAEPASASATADDCVICLEAKLSDDPSITEIDGCVCRETSPESGGLTI